MIISSDPLFTNTGKQRSIMPEPYRSILLRYHSSSNDERCWQSDRLVSGRLSLGLRCSWHIRHSEHCYGHLRIQSLSQTLVQHMTTCGSVTSSLQIARGSRQPLESDRTDVRLTVPTVHLDLDRPVDRNMNNVNDQTQSTYHQETSGARGFNRFHQHLIHR